MKPYAQIATLAELEQAQRRSTRRLAEQSRKVRNQIKRVQNAYTGSRLVVSGLRAVAPNAGVDLILLRLVRRLKTWVSSR